MQVSELMCSEMPRSPQYLFTFPMHTINEMYHEEKIMEINLSKSLNDPFDTLSKSNIHKRVRPF